MGPEKRIANFSFILIISSLILFASCKKSIATNDNVLHPSDSLPVITHLSPTSGSYNTVVLITGDNFDTIPDNNEVKFNGVEAKVLMASTSSLQVLVPNNSGTGPVTVTVKNGTATGPIFNYVVTDVYVAGVDNGFVVYWKNGVETILSRGNAMGSKATGIAVSGSDIYVAGYVGDTVMYWKNGVSVPMQNTGAGNTIAEGRAMALSGNDLYVVGFSQDNIAYGAAMWKNGIQTHLNAAVATSVAISGNDVYVCGYTGYVDVFENSDSAVYWKNQTRYVLASYRAMAMGIVVSGNDVYVCGNDNGDAVYWKNGVKNVLAYRDAEGAADANAIAVSGTDVVVTGSQHGYAVCWKNGLETVLTPPGTSSNSYAVTIKGSDVYISGFSYNFAAPGAVDGPVYWKNGIGTSLPNSSFQLARTSANAIAVVVP